MAHRLTLADLIYALGGWTAQNLAVPVQPVIDSRKVAMPEEGEAASVFFAFVGEHVDGHTYVEDALAGGAVAAVVAHEVALDRDVSVLDLRADGVAPAVLTVPLVIIVPDVLTALQQAARWWRLQIETRVIGITGSVGKTTTKEIVAQVLSERYKTVRSQGSYNNEIGLPLTLLGLTSDDAYAVLEMGMYVRGDIQALAEIARPDVGVLTNVDVVHAERAGRIEDIALAKRELVEVLPPGPDGVAILNYDDARVRAMADYARARVFSYGVSDDADLRASGVESLGLVGIAVTLHHGVDKVRLTVPLLGRHSVYPVLRGAAVGLVEGLTWDEIRRALEAPVDPIRLVLLPGLSGSTILDDTYNSSPPSALAALDLLADLDGRRVAVLGDMLELGPYEREGHLAVGCRAAQVASELVVVGDLGPVLAEGALGCGLTPDCIHSAPDSEEAAQLLPSLVQPGDVILVKGSRGVKMEHIVTALRVQAAN